jgi:hypothetical protein
MKYENNALLPRVNGKTKSRYEFVSNRVTDMLNDYGKTCKGKIVYVTDYKKSKHREALSKYLSELKMNYVIVTDFNSFTYDTVGHMLYDIIFDIDSLSSEYSNKLSFKDMVINLFHD